MQRPKKSTAEIWVLLVVIVAALAWQTATEGFADAMMMLGVVVLVIVGLNVLLWLARQVSRDE